MYKQSNKYFSKEFIKKKNKQFTILTWQKKRKILTLNKKEYKKDYKYNKNKCMSVFKV